MQLNEDQVNSIKEHMEHLEHEEPKPYAKLEKAVYQTIPMITMIVGLIALAFCVGWYNGALYGERPEVAKLEEQLNIV